MNADQLFTGSKEILPLLHPLVPLAEVAVAEVVGTRRVGLLIETWENALDRRALRKAPKTAVKEIFNWTSYLDPGPR